MTVLMEDDKLITNFKEAVDIGKHSEQGAYQEEWISGTLCNAQ